MTKAKAVQGFGFNSILFLNRVTRVLCFNIYVDFFSFGFCSFFLLFPVCCWFDFQEGALVRLSLLEKN